jgi:predicted permease
MTALRLALRSLARARTFTAASVATIALAVAAACSVFALVNAVLLRPLPYQDPDRLAGMWHTMPGLDIGLAKQSLGTYVLYREQAHSFEQTALFVSLAATLAFPNATPERVRAGWVTPTVFDVLGVRPLIGRTLTDSDAMHGAPDVAVISERLWRAHYAADPHILGRTVNVDGRAYTIVGVMPASFAFPEAGTPVWRPLDATHPPYFGSFGYDGIGRLRPGVTPEAAQRELARILPRAVERFPEQRPGVSTKLVLDRARMAPVIHPMRDDVIAGFDRVVWLIAGVVAMLVVVAFSNTASLSLVRSEARHREMAVRRALGASTATIWRDLLIESGVVSAVGAVAGLIAAIVAVSLLVRAAPIAVPRLIEVRIDAPVFVLTALLMLLFASASALIGVLRVHPRDMVPVLRDSARTIAGGRSARRLRAAFVGVEVAMSLALLAGAGVLGRSILRLRDVAPGFDASNVFTFWTFLPGTSYRSADDVARFYRQTLERFRRLPGVVSADVTAKLPLEVEGSPYRATIWGDDGSSIATSMPPVVQATTTSPGYFATMRIPFIAGRTYDEENVRRGAFEAVASRGYVNQVWHDPTGRSGVGKRVRPNVNVPWFTIVGVVDDVRDSTLALPPIAEVYFPEQPNTDTTGFANTTARDMAFIVRTRAPDATLPDRLRRELRALDPNLPFHRPATMEQLVADSRATTTFALIVLVAGASAALLLGIVGLYGAVAYVVSLRTRELSIRIALGLDPRRAPRLMLREGGVVVVVGSVAGVAIYAAAARLLGSLTFDVTPLDPSIIASALAGVVAIALAAMWLPARRAARINPAEALSAD